MSTKQAIAKLQGHIDKLYDGFLALKETSIYVREGFAVAKVYAEKGKGRGHQKVNSDLYVTCVHDTAKLALDEGTAAASLINIVNGIRRPEVHAQLRQEFCRWTVPDVADRATAAFFLEEQRQEIEKSAKLFDSSYSKLLLDWPQFEADKRLQSYKKIRDKVTAHLELKLIDGVYLPLEIGSLGLKWTDLWDLLEKMERYVVDLNTLIRRSSFPIVDFNKATVKEAKDFWSLE